MNDNITLPSFTIGGYSPSGLDISQEDNKRRNPPAVFKGVRFIIAHILELAKINVNKINYRVTGSGDNEVIELFFSEPNAAEYLRKYAEEVEVFRHITTKYNIRFV